jgi:pyochelin biosynthetic protein PchC
LVSSPDVFERWVKRFHPQPDADARLILLPYAGGSASSFFKLSAALPPTVEPWAVQYPGRQERRREQLPPDLRLLAADLAQVLSGRLDKPWVLLGHSLGALLGFELTRVLGPAGEGPQVLVASGRRAPSTFRDEYVHRLDDQGVAAELRRLSGTDPVFLKDPELFAMILPALRADYGVVERYECPPGVTVDTPIVALTGADDPKTTIEEARAWARHTTAGFDLRIFPGGHFFIDDCLSQVVNTLSDLLLPIHRSH